MVAADSSLDMNQIVQEYVADHDWERDKTHVRNTSTAVQLLVRAIVDTGDISESAMRTVYNICQNDNALKPSTKKQRIADLAIDEEAKSRLVDMIDEGTGIVGKGTYSVPIEGYEEEAFELLSTAIQSENRESIDAAIEDFAALDIDGVQAGIVSTILYFLNPTIYPISNKRSRTGMEQYFDYDMSAQLTGYVKDVDKFEEVRANYSFDSDYRHVDSFFNWIAKQDIGEDEDKSSTNSDDYNEVDTSSPSETLTEYWQEISDKEQAAEEFLQDPTSERFKEWIETFPWFVSRFTDAEEVLTDTTPENVAELLKQGATTGSLKKALELPGFGVAAATEALAILKPERFVALNNRAESGLEALQFNPPNPGVTSIRRYEEFSNQVDEAIDKYDFRSIVDDAPEWATPYQVATCAFYRHSEDQIDLTELLPDSETHSSGKDQSPQTEDIGFYWVNQNREVELREGYLRSQDQQWQRDLTVLEPGDIVFHYTDQAIRACSVVTKEAYQTEMDGGEYYRVEVSTNNLDAPLPLSNVRDALQDPDRRQDQNRYPLDKNGNVIQAYLCHLSSAAGEYLLKEANVDLPGGPTSSSKNYFWATANPSIWSVDEIAEGGDVLYTAYNDKGNKKRLFDAFKTAAPGDRVLFYESTPVKEIVGEGTVIEGLDTTTSSTNADATQPGSDDESDTEAGIRIQFERRVDGISWNDLTTIPDLEDAVPIANRAQGSFFPLTEAEFETVLALEEPVIDGVSQDAIDDFAAKLESPSISVEIPPGLYFEDDDRLAREIEASLTSGKHIIFTGPPGTGKTKLAKAICETARTYPQVDGYRFTTATSEWTAFDTIGGYVPSTSDGGQDLLFEPRLFLKCFRQDRVVNEWLIIDEINRSDIDKAFGQLFSVLSGDSTELPYEREQTVELLSVSSSTTEDRLADIISNPDAFPVTPSWRLIATMNTYDKTSLYEMSYAFMRRFNFVHVGVPPLTGDNGVRTSLLDPNGDDNYATAWLADDESLRAVLTEMYPVITVLWHRINKHRVIGPSIVYDIIRYLDSYTDTGGTHTDALTSAVVSLVYPQLEGMRPEKQKQLIRSLTDTDVPTEAGPVDLPLDAALLQQKAADFFGLTFDDDE